MASVQPMTFLALVQRLQRESGTSGAQITTTAGATGEAQRLCDWVTHAYVEIQEKHEDWLWMTQPFQFNTIAQQQAYSPFTTAFTTPNNPSGLVDFAKWKLNPTAEESSMRLWLTSIGNINETWLNEADWVTFRDFYIFGFRRQTFQRPITVAVDPQMNLNLGLAPNDIYTVVGEYYQSPQALLLDADMPAMPAMFHMLIVWYAIEHYAYYEAAAEVLEYAKSATAKMMTTLESQQLPPMQLPDPLV